MLRIKSINFTPQVLICYLLLLTVIGFESFKAIDKKAEPKKHSYSIEVLRQTNGSPMDVAIYDGDRTVDVIHLDTTCHLYKAIVNDNQ